MDFSCIGLSARAFHGLVIPPDDGITYATVDLYETIRVFEKYGVRFLAPEEIALELPAFPLCPSH